MNGSTLIDNPVTRAAAMRSLTKIYGRPKGMTGTDIWNLAMGNQVSPSEFGAQLAKKRAFDQQSKRSAARAKARENDAINQLSMAIAQGGESARDRASRERMHSAGLRQQQEMAKAQREAQQNRLKQELEHQKRIHKEEMEQRQRQNERLLERNKIRQERFRQRQQLRREQMESRQAAAEQKRLDAEKKRRLKQFEVQYKQLSKRLNTLQSKRPNHLTPAEQRALVVLPQRLDDLEKQMQALGKTNATAGGGQTGQQPSDMGIIEQGQQAVDAVMASPNNPAKIAAEKKFPGDEAAQRQWLLEQYVELRANAGINPR